MSNLLGRTDLLSARQVVALLPAKKHPQTVINWAKRGLRGAFLKSTVVLGEHMFTASDVEKFLEESSKSPEKRATEQATESPAPDDENADFEQLVRETQKRNDINLARQLHFEKTVRPMTSDERDACFLDGKLPIEWPPPPPLANSEQQS